MPNRIESKISDPLSNLTEISLRNKQIEHVVFVQGCIGISILTVPRHGYRMQIFEKDKPKYYYMEEYRTIYELHVLPTHINCPPPPFIAVPALLEDIEPVVNFISVHAEEYDYVSGTSSPYVTRLGWRYLGMYQGKVHTQERFGLLGVKQRDIKPYQTIIGSVQHVLFEYEKNFQYLKNLKEKLLLRIPTDYRSSLLSSADK